MVRRLKYRFPISCPCTLLFQSFQATKLLYEIILNEQNVFSDALTSARPLGGRLNPCLSGSGFNITLGAQQMLMPPIVKKHV